MFDLADTKYEVDDSGETTKITVHPEDMYPVIISRILHVLETGETPVELMALTERGGNHLAQLLVDNARKLPEDAWSDALKPRWEFSEVAYFSCVDKNGKINEELLDMIKPIQREVIVRMIRRGQALEIALAWFAHATRLKFGECRRIITAGKDGSKSFRL